MMRFFRPRCVLVVVALLMIPVLTQAQPAPRQDVSDLSLQDLLSIEVVSTASKFPQSIREAPASITVVTAEEIRRFGYRTLAEALKSVRGFYTTYDRNYTYVGMRGFARPGDYNTRILLLVDGHKLNDGIYDMAPVGTDFPIDIELIDRIEVIRGPGSSLYGTNAVFGVINVVTKSGSGRKGARAEVLGGSLGTGGIAASYGQSLGSGLEVLVSGSGYRSTGQSRIHYPEFDTDQGPGIAVGLDRDEVSRAFASASFGHFSVRAGAVHRHKHVPTASFGVVFGDNREATTDDRAFLSALYDGPLGGGWLASARLAYDYYGYQGAYPFDYGADGVAVYEDFAQAQALTGEITARRRVGRRQLLTVGAEVRRNLRSEQIARDLYGDAVHVSAPGTTMGIYVQDEVRLAPWLLLSGGMRVDRFASDGVRATPRAAAVFLPGSRTAIKLLHGSAFRAPNAYERFYYHQNDDVARVLEPEQIRSSEFVWEQTLSKYLRTTATAFVYDVDRIIEQRATGEGDVFFANAGATRGRGVEAEAEVQFDAGVVARASYTFVRVQDRQHGTPVSNSPEHLAKASLQVPVSQLMFAVDGQWVGSRRTLDGTPLPSFFMPSITMSSPTKNRVGISFSVFNVFNREYADPGAEEHTQAAIRQDGRTAQLRISLAF
jgi:outer membrane receptor for ferrienterochelin and colicins